MVIGFSFAGVWTLAKRIGNMLEAEVAVRVSPIFQGMAPLLLIGIYACAY